MELYLQIFLSTVAIAFGLLHLILFIYNKKLNANLYFSLFLFLYALNTFFDYQASLATTIYNEYLYLRIHRFLFPYPPIFALLFGYTLFNFKLPKQFWIISIGLILSSIPAVMEPVHYFGYSQIFLIGILFESIRLYFQAIKHKKEGAIIIFLAFSFLIFSSIYDVLLDFNVMEPVYNLNNGHPFGFLMLALLMSIYLARDFARVNKNILEKERETKNLELAQKLLEEEDKRKTKELNDARELQLSLLPNCNSHIGDYEICFDMRTASEVGGDYYDYSLSEEGELSIVIGDATDHGMKAGMMVSIIKSLFLARNEKMEITEFLNNCSRTVKQMKLKNLYMALMFIKIKNGLLTASSAGIPPFLIYRKKTNSIEEFKIKGMPLGALNSFPYQIVETKLNVGDTVLLMTDGLPELFNKEKELFGEDRLKEIFHKFANLPITKIVDKLFKAGEKWVGSGIQNDDITFVSFRITKNLIR